MHDGYSPGEYNDATYSGTVGSGSTAYKKLSNGIGELTDGTVASSTYSINKIPYVGWMLDETPTTAFNNGPVTIHFDVGSGQSIASVSISVDDPIAFSGGVGAPNYVDIGGTVYRFPANPKGAQSGPYTATIQLDAPITSSSVAVKLYPRYVSSTTVIENCGICATNACVSGDKPNGLLSDEEKQDCVPWVFVSEVQFFTGCSTGAFSECVAAARCKCAAIASVCTTTDTRRLEHNGLDFPAVGKTKDRDDASSGTAKGVAPSTGTRLDGKNSSLRAGRRRLSKKSKDTCGGKHPGKGGTRKTYIENVPSDELCVDTCNSYGEDLCRLKEAAGLLEDCPTST
jgi:hypothetical protein